MEENEILEAMDYEAIQEKQYDELTELLEKKDRKTLQKRLLSAARLIRAGVPAAKAAADSGFGDYSAFHRAFRESFGVSPGALRK